MTSAYFGFPIGRFSMAVAALLLAAPVSVWGQTARPGGSASAEMIRQLQQLASERTALQAENARMKRELEDLRKERDALKSGQQNVSARAQAAQSALSRAANERDAAEKESSETRSRMQELIGKYRELAQTLKEVETERATFKQALDEREREMKTCVDRNMELYELSDEVLTRLDNDSPLACVARAEPFTRLKRTQLENLIDEYRSRADDQKIPDEKTSKSGN